MEVNLTMHYIRSLNKDSLMEYLIDQKFTTEAQMLQSRDFDGERFLNFTELDLVHWGLKSTEKRKLLNCRNILLSRTLKDMPPKGTSPKNANPNLESKQLTLERHKNGKRNTMIRTQRPLPALPTNMQSQSDISADHEVSNRITSPRYLDMKRGNNECEENSEYVDMETKVMKNCVNETDRPAPKIPARPTKFRTDRDLVAELAQLQKAPVINTTHLQKAVQEKAAGNFTKLKRAPRVKSIPPLEIDEPEDYLEPTSISSATRSNSHRQVEDYMEPSFSTRSNSPAQKSREVTSDLLHESRRRYPLIPERPKITPLGEPEDYMEPTLISSANRSNSHRQVEDYMEPSFSTRSHSPAQKSREVTKDLLHESRQRYPLVPERPQRILPPVKVDKRTNREDTDNIYKADPHLEAQATRSRSKSSIQKLALPPIPTQNECARSSITSVSLPPMPSSFDASTEELYSSASPDHSEKPNLIMPQPVIRNSLEIRLDRLEPNSIEFIGNDLVDFDIGNHPPPPPEFLDTPPATAKDESDLPRPPKFSHESDPDLVNQCQDLIPNEDSSDEDTDFNPNDCIYYRNTDRKGAKQLLGKIKNLKDHTFLLRQSHIYFLGLTIFNGGDYYNVGIDRDQNGKFYGQSLSESGILKFCDLNSFIGHYKHNALTVKKRDGRLMELYLRYFLPHDVY